MNSGECIVLEHVQRADHDVNLNDKKLMFVFFVLLYFLLAFVRFPCV